MNDKLSTRKDFKVIICGAGIAGLTLANCLERAGILYTLLEARSSIAPQVGASIGILPNGARILDQLGIFDILRTYVADLQSDTVWVNQGKKKLFVVEAATLISKRSGYGSIFTERQIVLRHLYENLSNPSCVLSGKKVQTVDHGDEGVVVRCENGELYRGDVVVACDGVHSIVREEMRRWAEKSNPGMMENDRKSRFWCIKCCSIS
jgi:2-polyprenyl-6-methoxyphenol hydroxylase-like FAD-dependent oxidoreductase